MGARGVTWPIVVFDDWMSAAVVEGVHDLYDFAEPPVPSSRSVAFDRSFIPLEFAVESSRHGPVFIPRRIAESPQPEKFRRVARVSYRLHGPRAMWRWGKLSRTDDTDTRSMNADQLWDLLAQWFLVPTG